MKDAEQSILELAKKRFERFGYRKTTIDEICRDGGISKKTVYAHFRDKEDLFARVLVGEALSARAEVFRRLVLVLVLVTGISLIAQSLR